MSAPFKRIMAFDFETAWSSSEYTLSKMTTEEYIRDPRFKAWGMAFKYLGYTERNIPPQWVPGKDLPEFFASIDWSTTAVLAQNTAFDAAILRWRYGHLPCFMFDTLSMARAVRGVDAGNSLKALADAFGFPPKGDDVRLSDGILTTLPRHIEDKLASYCVHDVELCIDVFEQLSKGFPAKELKLIDLTLRMFVDPKIVLDKDLLQEALTEERVKREGLLSRLITTEDELASNDKFADVLLKMGVAPPMKKKKPTPTTPNPVGETYAFAKTDMLFQALLNGENEDVALLCEARLAVKSTLMRTRAQRFLDIAGRGSLPVPLNYYGAHTGRWAAGRGSNINLQNLKRGSALRKAIMAPDGYVIVVCDLSQIEPRVLAWLADYHKLLNIFASGEDAYAAFGAQMFGIPGMTKESHPDLRQSAKSALLGAGYGLGWASFAAQLLTGFLGAPPILYNNAFAKQLGVTKEMLVEFIGYQPNVDKAMAIPRLCSDREILVHCVAAKQIIDIYRAAAQPVKRFWEFCDEVIVSCLSGGKRTEHKCLNFEKGRIILPSGLALLYPDLKGEADDKGRVQWRYGNKNKKLYGGKLTENIVQAVARCVMTDGMLRIQKRYPCVLTVHDEVVVLVPEEEAFEGEAWVLEQMVRMPSYMPGIPLAAETGVNKRYGEAK
jgi:DNA polymerase family A